MKNFSFHIFILLIFSSVSVFGQTQKQLIRTGDQLSAEGDHYGASIYYKKAIDLEAPELSLVFKYAESLRKYNDYEKAKKYYKKIYLKDRGRTYPLAPYWMATMQKMDGDYKEAEKSFRRSKRSFMRDRKSFHYKKIVQEKESCDFARKLMNDSLNINIKNAGHQLNTYDSEFGARFYDDSTIYYSSLRAEKITDDNVVIGDEYLVRIYRGYKKNDQWQTNKKLPELINEEGYHVANGSFSPDGKRFYFTKCDSAYSCNIYKANFDGESWNNPEKLHDEINWNGYSNTHPFECVIGNKQVLLFSSNRPYGSGKFDIWYSIIDEYGAYGNPINLGNEVNSIDDEITPFYNSKEKTLYFSSDWYFGLGGFDVFKSKGVIGEFEEPENMGFPINSPTNDIYYAIEGSTVFLTSNRKGSMAKKGETCCNDLYTYEIDIDTVKEDTSLIAKLEKYLPLSLYFHNDIPNPRSWDTTTSKNYLETYREYTQMIDKYVEEYSKGLEGDDKIDAEEDIKNFFEDYVDQGAEDLQEYTPLLLEALQEGKDIKVTVKGYASPLAKSDYNVNLTLRRISSLRNYLREYKDGVFLPYLNSTDEDSIANLSLVNVPYGEYESKKLVSDNINDLKNSVYSRAAARERKIEIIAVSVNDTADQMLDGSEMEKQAKIGFTETPGNLEKLVLSKGEQKELKHIFKNEGDKNLEIFNADMPCKCFEVTYPEESIAPGNKGQVNVIIPPEAPSGKYQFSLQVITNGVPSEKEFNYEFELIRK